MLPLHSRELSPLKGLRSIKNPGGTYIEKPDLFGTEYLPDKDSTILNYFTLLSKVSTRSPYEGTWNGTLTKVKIFFVFILSSSKYFRSSV